MPANPFYIQPAGNFGAELTGLAGVVGEIGERKKAEEKEQAEITRIDEMKRGALDIMENGTEDDMRKFVVANPEMAQTIKTATEIKFPGSGDRIGDAYFAASIDSTKAPEVFSLMQEQANADGVITPEESAKMDEFQTLLRDDPEKAQDFIKKGLYIFGSKEQVKRYQDITKGGDTKQHEGLTAGYKEYLISNNLKNSPEEYARFQEAKKTSDQEYSPSPLKKMINERQQYIDDGFDVSHPVIKAYDSKISGVDIDIKDMTDEEIDTWGSYVALTGKLPSVGRGKQATKIRVAILKSAARQSLGADKDGIPDAPDKTPVEAALSMLGEQSDTKAIQGSLNFLDKQMSAMGSFITNINSQVDKVSELAKDLKTFDSRILNVPLRSVRGRIKGSALQAKYDMYLTEIEGEIGKLASGSPASVAELSAGAQEKWAKIHDKNLSVKDMLSLLEETKSAANFRLESVEDQLDKTRKRMRREGTLPPPRGTGRPDVLKPTPQAEIEAMEPGGIFIGPDGKQYRRN